MNLMAILWWGSLSVWINNCELNHMQTRWWISLILSSWTIHTVHLNAEILDWFLRFPLIPLSWQEILPMVEIISEFNCPNVDKTYQMWHLREGVNEDHMRKWGDMYHTAHLGWRNAEKSCSPSNSFAAIYPPTQSYPLHSVYPVRIVVRQSSLDSVCGRQLHTFIASTLRSSRTKRYCDCSKSGK